MKSAIYYQGLGSALPLQIARENKDGTVDLANAEGIVIVSNVPISTVPRQGSAMLSDGVVVEEQKGALSLALDKCLKLREELINKEKDLAERNAVIEQKTLKIKNQGEKIDDLTREILKKDKELEDSDSTIKELNVAIDQRNGKLKELGDAIVDQDQEILKRGKDLEAARAELKDANAQLAKLKHK